MTRRFKLLALLLIIPMVATAFGDTIGLRDGRRYDGTFLSGSSTGILFQDAQGVRHRFSLGDVQFMEFGTYSMRNSPPRTDSYGSLVIPRGTEFPVRTDETIDSNHAVEGQRFMAYVNRDIYDVSGVLAIPQGSPAELVIRRIEDPSITNSAEMILDIDSVTVGDRRYRVSTTDLEATTREGLGANRRTGSYVGGGAALGAIIGAIAGGGKGAAIGAGVGAGAGAAGQILTRGRSVYVPAETLLRFRLDRNLHLDPY